MTGQPIARRTFGKLAATVAAFGATVSLAGEDGTPLPANQAFVADFEAVRTTGDQPR